jgi:hypothetical protein
VTRVTPRTIIAALAVIGVTAVAIGTIGCGNGRPPGVADRPGDNYVELSDLAAELVVGTEIKIRVHYRFPDELPHPDTWFQFYFEVNDGKSGTSVVRKQGRELTEDGDIETSASVVFIKRSSIRVRVKVQQGKSKNGPWHDVSDSIVIDS